MSTAQPVIATAVAPAQRRPGRTPSRSQDSRPVKTGPLPMATTVPTATPVLPTAAKKQSWYAATASAAAASEPGRAGNRRDRAGRARGGPPGGSSGGEPSGTAWRGASAGRRAGRVTAARTRPPITRRAAARETGSTPATRTPAVPAVPQSTAAPITAILMGRL
ncbi:hypothetical protein [Streptosporangium longisporum]|uniref:hypothetical protein n=1 Tax=Streptosporangium longisporum TaxID=46187 RepID=UPI0031F059AA